MILHSVCTTCSLIPYYHPHDNCILCVQLVRLFHITIHMIVHSVCTMCSLIPYYHPHGSAFCLYNVFAYSILSSTWYCILCVQRVHVFHITIHMIMHSVCTTCSLIPYYHPHDSAFCLYNVFAYSILPSTWYCILFVQRVHLCSILPSTWYCILFVQRVHLVHITTHMILHSVCTTFSLVPYYHPHDIAFCYNVFTYSLLPSTW